MKVYIIKVVLTTVLVFLKYNFSGAQTDCGPLEDPENGLVSIANNIATYTCNEGFDLVGIRLRFCRANGGWTGLPPQCLVIDCGGLLDPSNGMVNDSVTTFGAQATYTCDMGFTLGNMIATRTCLIDGTWSGSQPECTVIDCGILLPPTNGFITLTGTIFGFEARYSCQSSFVLAGGNETRFCQENAQWSGNEPICELADCGPLDAPQNGTVVLGSLGATTVNSIAFYTCEIGFDLIPAESLFRTCLENGEWSAEDPTCEPRDCGELDDPLNGTVNVPSTTFGSQATYVCDIGFNLEGESDTRTCQSIGAWSGRAPECIAVDCGPLSSPENGNIELPDTTFRSTAVYSCESQGGFALRDGDRIRTCQSNGIWSGNAPICERVICETLEPPENGFITFSGSSGNIHFLDTLAVYVCDEGFELVPDIPFRRCEESGEWSEVDPICALSVDCGVLNNPVNGAVEFTSMMLGSVATYSCDIGYILDTDSTRTCGVNAAWSGRDPQCQIADCGSPSAIPSNGDVVYSTTVFQSIAMYSCEEGYELTPPESEVRECLANETWQGTDPTCEPIRCTREILTNPDNGAVAMTNENVFQSVAMYTCIEGFTIIGDNTRVCGANGEWSGSTPECQIIMCPRLIPPDNGEITVTSTSGGPLATYSCDEGYRLSSNVDALRICSQTTGEWSGNTAPTCIIEDCGPPSEIEENGEVLFGNTVFESIAFYSCDEGYVLNPADSDRRMCLANRTWEGMDPTCEPIDCGSLENPDNGTVSTVNTTLDSEAVYTCSSGFVLEGEMTRVCQSNGVWSNSPPVCQEISCGELSNPLNGLVSFTDTTIGSIATYICDELYVLDGDDTRQCQLNGTWSGPEPTCQIDFSDCQICSRNAECLTISEERILCQCFQGFDGNGITCTNVNECLLGQDNCDINADCFDIMGGFGCNCREGYTGSGTTCENVNECLDGSNTCSLNANCIDRNGSFDCECREGFTGDGFTCVALCTTLFQLVLSPVTDCEAFTNDAMVVNDITSAIVNGVNSNCNQQTSSCVFDEESISSAETTCVFGDRPLYRASLASSGSGCNDRLSSLRQWIDSDEARAVVVGQDLVIANDCTVEVESFLETPVCSSLVTTADMTTSDVMTVGPDTTVSGESDNRESVIIGASVGAAGLLIFIAIVILVALGVCALVASQSRKKRPARYIDVQTNVSNGHRRRRSGRNQPSNDYIQGNPSAYRPPYPTARPPQRPSLSETMNTDEPDGDLRMSTFNPESSVMPTLARSYSRNSNILHHVVQNPGATETETEENVPHLYISNGLTGSSLTQL